MYYVYVLYSEVNDKIYIGFTNNPQGRLEAHNHPKNKGWTKRYQPWRIIHSEPFSTKDEAMKREQELKSHQGRDFIRKLIRN
ncbi:MAG: GIY-YIG nuclease family protein [Bacteroidales bacterium]|nr:GIY-YIG nuclease family protein [Bacteroidales bacterium]